MVRKNTTSLLGKIIIPVILLFIVGTIAYLGLKFKDSEHAQEGFFVCNKEKTICEESRHIHADIIMTVCGEEIAFARDKGRTDMQHTHKEKNKIHWHNRVRVHPETKEPLIPRHLVIEEFFKQMRYRLPLTCPKNSSPTLTVSLNGEVVENGLATTWEDDDSIDIVYE